MVRGRQPVAATISSSGDPSASIPITCQRLRSIALDADLLRCAISTRLSRSCSPASCDDI
jgi:hypothetical protein